MDVDVATAAPKEDFRVRSARRKRERMSAHLLKSVLAVYPGEDSRTPAVIDDVVRHAEVSRGTFYNHFTSLEQAIERLASQLADELAASYVAVYAQLTDPKLHAVTGFQLYLSRAHLDPHWGTFVGHLNQISRRDGLLMHIRIDLEAGAAAGVFVIRDMDAALDLIIGAKVEAIRRLVVAGGSRQYIETMASMMLRALGVAPAEADRAAEEGGRLLRQHAPGALPWWRDFE